MLRCPAWMSSKRLSTDAGPLRAKPRTTIPAMGIEALGETPILHPIEDVFDFLADPRNEPKWLPGARSVTKTSDGPVGAGSKFVGEYQRAGRVELELAEFQRPVRVTFRARSKIVHFDDVVELAPFENG